MLIGWSLKNLDPNPISDPLQPENVEGVTLAERFEGLCWGKFSQVQAWALMCDMVFIGPFQSTGMLFTKLNMYLRNDRVSEIKRRLYIIYKGFSKLILKRHVTE